jgi:hypothetical protein
VALRPDLAIGLPFRFVACFLTEREMKSNLHYISSSKNGLCQINIGPRILYPSQEQQNLTANYDENTQRCQQAMPVFNASYAGWHR